MVPDSWLPHRRTDDDELLGWLRPAGDAFVPVSRLGRDIGEPSDQDAAEASLESRGLGWLADRFELTLDDGTTVRVRIVEVTPDRVIVKEEDFGDMTAATASHALPFPAPAALRAL